MTDAYVGLCAESPSLSWLAATTDEAFSGMRRVVADCIADLKVANESVPRPIAGRTYSGKFRLRVPLETHRALAIRAAEEGVSLKRLRKRAARTRRHLRPWLER